MITIEITNATQYATAYQDDKPIATVQRARISDRAGPRWSAFDLDGKILFATMFDLDADGIARRIQRELNRRQASPAHA